jgi:hypothetical protein
LSSAVFDSQLLYYVGKPEEIINLQGMAPSAALYRFFLHSGFGNLEFNPRPPPCPWLTSGSPAAKTGQATL